MKRFKGVLFCEMYHADLPCSSLMGDSSVSEVDLAGFAAAPSPWSSLPSLLLAELLDRRWVLESKSNPSKRKITLLFIIQLFPFNPISEIALRRDAR